jgi:hypothetical protein
MHILLEHVLWDIVRLSVLTDDQFRTKKSTVYSLFLHFWLPVRYCSTVTAIGQHCLQQLVSPDSLVAFLALEIVLVFRGIKNISESSLDAVKAAHNLA